MVHRDYTTYLQNNHSERKLGSPDEVTGAHHPSPTSGKLTKSVRLFHHEAPALPRSRQRRNRFLCAMQFCLPIPKHTVPSSSFFIKNSLRNRRFQDDDMVIAEVEHLNESRNKDFCKKFYARKSVGGRGASPCVGSAWQNVLSRPSLPALLATACGLQANKVHNPHHASCAQSLVYFQLLDCDHVVVFAGELRGEEIADRLQSSPSFHPLFSCYATTQCMRTCLRFLWFQLLPLFNVFSLSMRCDHVVCFGCLSTFWVCHSAFDVVCPRFIEKIS